MRPLFLAALLLGLCLTPCPAQEIVMAPYPAEAFSRPTQDRLNLLETLDRVGIAWDVRTRALHYEHNRLALVQEAGRTWTRWDIRPRDVDVTALVLHHRLYHLPRCLSLTVRNLSATPISFVFTADELAWLPQQDNSARTWVFGETQQVGPGEERRLAWFFAEEECATEGGGPPLRLPLNALVVHLRGLAPGQEHTLLLSDLQVDYPTAQEAGLAGTQGFNGPLSLELRRDERVYWRRFVTDEEAQSFISGEPAPEPALPWWIPAGDHVLGLVCGGYRVEGRQVPLSVPPRAPAQLPLAERRLYNGRPTFFFNGRSFCWNGYSSYDYQPGNVTEFGAHGATVLCIPTCAGAHVHGVAEQNWVTSDQFDFGELDERVAFSLQANPEAVLFLRLSLNLPAWWAQAHPDDLAVVRTDQGDLHWEETGFFRGASLASPAWLLDQERALRALIAHCRAQPWASRLAGIWLSGQVTEEWFNWGCNDGFYSDYSPAAQAAYSDWLAQQPFGATLPQAIPDPALRQIDGYDVFPDTEAGRRAAAYHGYLSELSASTISHFARVVKEATGGRTLVGCFYGYVIQLAGEPRQALAGQFGLRQLLDDPNIDFLASVPLHDGRDLSWGYNPYCSATDSIQAAGKLFCNENDLFSWLHPILWHVLYDPADPRAAAVSMHRRECAGDAVRGVLAQKFSLMASWHHDPALQEDFALQQRVLAGTLELDRTGVEEIAFVVDEATLAWTPPASRLLQETNRRLLHIFGRTGAPVGVWLLSDVDRLPERIRLVVIAGATAAREADLGKLRTLLARGGRTVLMVGLPGLVNTETQTWERQRPGELLGLPLTARDEALSGTLLDEAGGVVVELHEFRPRGEVDGRARLRYPDGAGAWAERDLPAGGRLIWCGGPPNSVELARTLCARAGVFCYAPPGCFVHASRELVAVTSNIAQDAEIRLPAAGQVTDLFDGWQGEGSRFRCPFALGQTRLLHVRSSG